MHACARGWGASMGHIKYYLHRYKGKLLSEASRYDWIIEMKVSNTSGFGLGFVYSFGTKTTSCPNTLTLGK